MIKDYRGWGYFDLFSICQAMAAPSAAAAAGAAAAALLQRQLLQGSGEGWTEHQTGDGRKFFHNEVGPSCHMIIDSVCNGFYMWDLRLGFMAIRDRVETYVKMILRCNVDRAMPI